MSRPEAWLIGLMRPSEEDVDGDSEALGHPSAGGKLLVATSCRGLGM